MGEFTFGDIHSIYIIAKPILYHIFDKYLRFLCATKQFMNCKTLIDILNTGYIGRISNSEKKRFINSINCERKAMFE
jgi:hypothetical protein